jgi:hypothetical protein
VIRTQNLIIVKFTTLLVAIAFVYYHYFITSRYYLYNLIIKYQTNKQTTTMKFTNAIICLVATASTVTAQEQVACTACQSPDNFPGGFNFKDPQAAIPPIPTINNIPSPEAEDVFISEFVAITDSKELGTVFPVNLALIGAQNAKPTGGAPVIFPDTSRSLLGTIFYTNGDLFNSVTLVEQSEIDSRKSNTNEFVGGRVVTEREPPVPAAGYTFRGQCTVVSDQVKLTTNKSDNDTTQFFAQISGHTCLYDMCFGGSDCILIYSGTPFVFDIRSGELPPGFSGFVAGGTGSFAGIGGSVDILTVTGRTKIGDFTPDALIGVETIFPAAPLAGSPGASFNEQNGEITQKIFLTTNQVLPPVPGTGI